MQNKLYNPITEGKIVKEVFILFIPILIASFFQHLYSIVDGIIVGEFLGTLAFSAVGGSSAKIITMLINFFIGVSAGITAYTARFYGRGDMAGVRGVLINGMGFFTIFAILLSIVGIIFTENILSLMSTPEETMDLSITYLRVFLFGLVFCVIYNTLTGVLRAMGDAKTPLYILIFCSFLNIALDLLFVLTLKMGVSGVAIATLISQGISAILLAMLVRKKIPKNSNERTRFSLKMIAEICAIGIPAGLQSIMYSFSNILVQSAVNGFGVVAVAAWAAYLKVDSIIDIFIISIGSTVITFVGQNLGAGKIDRMKKAVRTIITMSYAIVIVIMAIFIFFRAELLGLFTNDIDVILAGTPFFFIIMPMYLLGIPQSMLIKALQGMGKSFVPMILTMIGVIGIRVLWVLFALPMYESIYFLALCYPLSAILMSIILIFYYRYTIRKF